jgi:hypothetical protein
MIDYGALLRAGVLPIFSALFGQPLHVLVTFFAAWLCAYLLYRQLILAVASEKLVAGGSHYWKRQKGGGRVLTERTARGKRMYAARQRKKG